MTLLSLEALCPGGNPPSINHAQCAIGLIDLPAPSKSLQQFYKEAIINPISQRRKRRSWLLSAQLRLCDRAGWLQNPRVAAADPGPQSLPLCDQRRVTKKALPKGEKGQCCRWQELKGKPAHPKVHRLV